MFVRDSYVHLLTYKLLVIKFNKTNMPNLDVFRECKMYADLTSLRGCFRDPRNLFTNDRYMKMNYMVYVIFSSYLAMCCSMKAPMVVAE